MTVAVRTAVSSGIVCAVVVEVVFRGVDAAGVVDAAVGATDFPPVSSSTAFAIRCRPVRPCGANPLSPHQPGRGLSFALVRERPVASVSNACQTHIWGI